MTLTVEHTNPSTPEKTEPGANVTDVLPVVHRFATLSACHHVAPDTEICARIDPAKHEAFVTISATGGPLGERSLISLAFDKTQLVGHYVGATTIALPTEFDLHFEYDPKGEIHMTGQVCVTVAFVRMCRHFKAHTLVKIDVAQAYDTITKFIATPTSDITPKPG